MHSKESLFNTPSLTGNVYADLERTVGVKSLLAESHLATLRQTVSDGIHEKRLDREEFYRLQDDIYSEERRGEITLDEMLKKLKNIEMIMSATRNFEEAKNTLEEYSRTARIDGVIENQNDLTAINTLISRAEPISSSDVSKAPFRNYLHNTDQSWEYVSAEDIRDFLLRKPFIDDWTLGEIELNNAASVTTLRHTTSSDEVGFCVPTNVMISAAGFGSWLGRSSAEGYLGEGEKSIALPGFLSTESKSLSLHAIKAYASYPEELPPVNQISVYVQPDGIAYAGNESGDSHRIGAAILRGESTIRATGLRVVLLGSNTLKPRSS